MKSPYQWSMRQSRSAPTLIRTSVTTDVEESFFVWVVRKQYLFSLVRLLLLSDGSEPDAASIMSTDQTAVPLIWR
jgi:hypothetical protein